MTEAGEPDTATLARARPLRERLIVLIGGALAVFLLGAATGVLVGLPGSGPETPAPGPVDIGFSQDMTFHHEQAVTMATDARARAADPRIRQIAYDIESNQTAQIGTMQGWLMLWGAPGLPTGGHMSWMGAAHTGHGGATAGNAVALMPGMATSEELRALREASGPEFDVLFLQLMLRHHEGGTEMLAHGAEHAAVPTVRNLAGQMLAAQTGESALLRDLLAEKGAQPLPL